MRIGKGHIAAVLIVVAAIAIACGGGGAPEPATPASSTADVADEASGPQPTDAAGSTTATDEPDGDGSADERSNQADGRANSADSSAAATDVPDARNTQDRASDDGPPGRSRDRPATATDEPATSSSPRRQPPVGLDPRVQISDWSTDFAIHSVPLEEFLPGGPPKDGIRSLEDPPFISLAKGDESFVDNEPVVAIEIDGDARAYPLGILTRHEIANDVVGGVPVAVTFCPLCNSAIVFERELDGVVYEFGVSGLLRNSDLVMYDRQTESWWQQFTGEALVGELTGALLEVVPSSLVSYGDYKETYPDGRVMSTETGFDIDYGFNPYVGYDSDDSPFLFRGPPDTRLSPIERVVALELSGDAIAYPYSVLEEERVVHDTVGGEDVVVLFQFGTSSALDGFDIGSSSDIGAAGVFRPAADGKTLTFSRDGDEIVDDQTGSRWNVLGLATDGPLAGARLELVSHANHFWFAWAAFKPDTRIYGG